MERAEKKCGLGFHILEFPLHILCDIFFKLPAWSLIRCTTVCTAFRNLINDPSFRKLYISRAPTTCLVLSDRRYVSCIDCRLLCSASNSNHGSSSCLATIGKTQSSATGFGQQHRRPAAISDHGSRRRFITIDCGRPVNLVNSANGLLCLRTFGFPHDRAFYYICNPLSGELMVLPIAPSPVNQNLRFCAFGYDALSNRYKILQLVVKSSNKMVAELFQIGDDKWRVIDNNVSSSVSARASSAFDPSLNGALHWVTQSPRISELICSFDLNKNEFKWVAPPSHFDEEYLNEISGISVGVLKGCLCLCYVKGSDLFETWLMESYGEVESWTKAFSIDIKSYVGLRPQDKHRPIGFSSSGDMLLKADSGSDSNSHSLVSYSAETGMFRNVDIGGIASNIQATPHVLSFLSLKDMLNVRDNNKVVNVRRLR